MKADNVFRFVASRPPMTVDMDDPRLVRGPASVDELADLIRDSARFNADPEAARVAAGEEVIDSSYYRSDPEWERVRKHRHKFVGLNAESDHDAFVKVIERLLRRTYDRPHLSLDEWVKSDNYSALRDTIWVSYLANVIAPNERPQDREELVDWIVLLHLASAGADGEERFDELKRFLPELRPLLPGNLFEAAQPADIAPQPPIDDHVQERALENEKENLEIALLQLAKLSASKRSRPAEFAVARPRWTRLGSGRRDEDGLEISQGGAREVPWQLTEADLPEYPELSTTLDELGLESTASIPEVRSRVESELARINGELAGGWARMEVVGAGSTETVVDRRLGPTGVGDEVAQP